MSKYRQRHQKHPLTELQTSHFVDFRTLLECFELLLSQREKHYEHNRVRLEVLCSQTVETKRIPRIHSIALAREAFLVLLREETAAATSAYVEHIQETVEQLREEGIPIKTLRRAVRSFRFPKHISSQLTRRPQAVELAS